MTTEQSVPSAPDGASRAAGPIGIGDSIGANPWVMASEPASIGDPSRVVMLVEGQAFCLCDRAGDIDPASPQGVFFADLRVLSRLTLVIDGETIEPLTVAPSRAYGATIVGRTSARHDGGGLLVLRRRRVGMVLREDIEIRNHSANDVLCTVQLLVGVDFADLFAVKEGRVHPEGEHSVDVQYPALIFEWRLEDAHRRVRMGFSTAALTLDHRGPSWSVRVPAKGQVLLSWDLDVAIGERWMGTPASDHLLDPSDSQARYEEWSRHVPSVETDHDPLADAVRRAVEDIGSLRLFDAENERLPVIAAGAPWFMTLFGRDALLTSYMALPVDPTLALGVLETLAELQGERSNARTEEQPGRIMHETRFEVASSLALDAGATYYGSVDATPLFVVLLGELSRWGLPEDVLRRLLPHADRALAWIEDYGDRDADGYVEYERMTPRGLANQGWKDSWDAIRHRDGSIARAPIALAEVQGYVFAAYRARAEIARRLGQSALAERYDQRAEQLADGFNRDFWMDDLGWFAMGLDDAKQQIGALGSNMGHCLWTGIVDPRLAARVADTLLSASMWGGWGIRTMAANETAYNPLSYHCGSVWPHDNAITAAGLMRYGFTDAAHRIIIAMLDAAAELNGRLPELFCGIDRSEIALPVPYPTSCSPQAWSAASPLLFLRTILQLQPDLANGRLHVAPQLPKEISSLDLRGLHLWDATFDLRVHAGELDVTGLPDGLELVRTPLPCP